MPAPIAVEIAASPASTAERDPSLENALVDACTGAAGADRCVLEDSVSPVEARARVVVSFADGIARVHVEARARVEGLERATSRDVIFRDDDPPAERYRAAGLVAVALVAELQAPPAPAPPPRPPESPRRGSGVDLRLDGGAGLNDADRPWLLGELGADIALVRPFFLTVSALYGQTTARDDSGIAAQRSAAALGAGVEVPLASVALRIGAEVTGNLVRATVVQPSTGREDSGARALVGGTGEMDLVVPLGGPVGLTAGVRLANVGGRTSIRVQDRTVEAVDAWIPEVTVGLDLRLP